MANKRLITIFFTILEKGAVLQRNKHEAYRAGLLKRDIAALFECGKATSSVLL
jgi:hypothetical protein